MSAIGITASRHGLTPAQTVGISTWLHVLHRVGASVFHHGDCVGGDVQAARIARQLGYFIVSHPPSDERLRAHFPSDETWEQRDYHDRNKDIVSESDVLFACPAEPSEQPRGGTWWTVRYARKVNEMYAPDIRRPVVVIAPDGQVIR